MVSLVNQTLAAGQIGAATLTAITNAVNSITAGTTAGNNNRVYTESC